MEFDNRRECGQKEIEFINLYGRKDLGLGTLINNSNGGEGGGTGRIMTQHERDAISLRFKGKCVGAKSILAKEIFIYDVDGNFVKSHIGINELCKQLNLSIGWVMLQLKGEVKHVKKLRFFREYRGEKIKPMVEYGTGHTRRKQVYQLDDDFNVIRTFNSTVDAAK